MPTSESVEELPLSYLWWNYLSQAELAEDYGSGTVNASYQEWMTAKGLRVRLGRDNPGSIIYADVFSSTAGGNCSVKQWTSNGSSTPNHSAGKFNALMLGGQAVGKQINPVSDADAKYSQGNWLKIIKQFDD